MKFKSVKQLVALVSLFVTIDLVTASAYGLAIKSKPVAVSVKAAPTPGVLPVVPGVYGYGADTKAGRGGAIIRVTNLNASGAGSLAACVAASGPRVCVFETSGVITLPDNIYIQNPYITIAGQTAPAPGILIKGSAIRVLGTHDVLIQHLQLRPGDGPGFNYEQRNAINVGAFNGQSAYNVVIDHVSAGWTTDQIFDTWGDNGWTAGGGRVYNVTASNSIFADPLNNSFHPKGAHPMGVLLGAGTTKVTFIRNIMAQAKYRNPLINTGANEVIVGNNLLYNPGSTGSGKIDLELDVEGIPGPYKYWIAGNVVIPRSGDTSGKAIWVIPDGPSDTKIYASDNRIAGVAKDWDGVGAYGTVNPAMQATSSPIAVPAGLSLMSSALVEARLIKCAGNRPAQRDAIDLRTISNIVSRTGTEIDTPSQAGGYPNYPVNTRSFVAPANPSGDDDGDGYTNLEELLQQMAAQLEGC